MQGDGAQQSPGHGACHHTHAETSAHEPEVASPIFPIGDVGDIGASNRTCGAGDAGHDASGVEDPAKAAFDSLQASATEYIGYAWAMVVVIVGATIGIKLFKKFTSKAS